MLTKSQCQSVFRKVIKLSDADETEAIIFGREEAVTRFANNLIHQNVYEENYILSIRVIYDGKTSRVSTNKFDEKSIRRCLETAKEIAMVQPKDTDLLPMPGKQTYREVDDFFNKTLSFSANQRAEAVKKVIVQAEKFKLTVAGILSTSLNVNAIGNSKGLFAYHRNTGSNFSATAMRENSSGFVSYCSPNVEEIDTEELGKIAIGKALMSSNPQEISPGKYTVVLEPSAVDELFGFLVEGFSGQAVLEGSSFLTNKIGTKLFGENINIKDDVYHKLQSGIPFDYEGVPRKRVTLVEKGKVKNVVYSRISAKKSETKPTGHGFSLPNTIGEFPLNIVMQGNTHSVEQMIASTERGILITRTWYNRLVDQMKLIITGMTRDGTFYIEDGKIKYGIKNLRFNESLIDLLNNIEAMGPEVRASATEFGTAVVPALKVKDFNFTEVTRF